MINLVNRMQEKKCKRFSLLVDHFSNFFFFFTLLFFFSLSLYNLATSRSEKLEGMLYSAWKDWYFSYRFAHRKIVV